MSGCSDLTVSACLVNVHEHAVIVWTVDATAELGVLIRNDADASALLSWWKQHHEVALAAAGRT